MDELAHHLPEGPRVGEELGHLEREIGKDVGTLWSVEMFSFYDYFAMEVFFYIFIL